MTRSLYGVIFFLVLLGQSLFGQHISGTITNLQGESVIAANVILKQGDVILDFSATDNQGYFELTIEVFHDSLFFEITHLAYNTKRTPLDKAISVYSIELFPRSYKLPEISVKAPAVVRQGDTLTFSIESYIKDGDESIEEVLRRIPGVTVSDNGAIKYKGLPINKFYIEGLDMLEGRYQIVTKNLGLQHVQDIQVIERHQPIQALDSIYRPENAAINLKLKSNVAFTGSVKGELAAPLGGLAAINLFGFTKKYQFNLNGSFNDLGDQLGVNYTTLYPSQQVQNKELLQLKKPYRPFFYNGNRIVHNNREFTGGINFLRRIGKYTQIKLQGYGLKDRVIQNGTSLSEYFLGDQSSTFAEELTSTGEPQELDGRAILEYNSKQFYTRINTQLTSKRNQSIASNVINSQSTKEFLEKDGVVLNSDLSFILTRNRNAYRLNADIHYEDIDHQLDILDSYVSIPQTGQRFFPELSQLANTQNLLIKLYTSFLIKRGNVNGLIEVGPQLTRKSITSSTFDQQENGHLIDPDFQNNHLTHRKSLAIDQEWTYEKEKIRMQLKIPTSYDHFNISNKLHSVKQVKRYLNYQPTFDFNIKLYKENSIGFRFGYFKDVYTYGDLFFDGLIVQSNRNTMTQSREPNEYKGYTATISVGGINHIKDRYLYINLTYRNQLADQINNNVFDSIGILSQFNVLENRSESYSLHGMMKLAPIGSFDFDLQGNYTIRDMDRLINSALTTFRDHRLYLQPQCTFSFKQNATVLSSRWTWTRIKETDLENIQLELGISHYWQASSKSGLDLNYRFFSYGNFNNDLKSHILNLEYQYDWTPYKTKIHVGIINLLNEHSFTTYFQGPYFDSFNTFQLNPRRFQISFKKTL